MMKDSTFAIYCLIDDLLQKIGNCYLDKRRKLTNSQVINTAVLSCKYFYGNQASACKYLADHYGFTMPDKSNFSGTPPDRILHSLTDLIADLFFHLGMVFKELNLQSVYLIDSFPVFFVKISEFLGLKLLKEKSFVGIMRLNVNTFMVSKRPPLRSML